MVRIAKDALSDRAIWFLIGLVVVCVLLVLVIVFRHDEPKPQSPQSLAAAAMTQLFGVQEWKPGMGKQPFMYHPAGLNRTSPAAFNQLFPVQEWKPGMGKKPLVYHPAGFNKLVWKPLPARNAGATAGAWAPGTAPYSWTVNPGAGQVYGTGRP